MPNGLCTLRRVENEGRGGGTCEELKVRFWERNIHAGNGSRVYAMYRINNLVATKSPDDNTNKRQEAIDSRHLPIIGKSASSVLEAI